MTRKLLQRMPDIDEIQHLSLDRAAEMMAVSSATIRNWAKAGHIEPVSAHPLLFSEESVSSLQDKINSGSFGRLKTRANKARAVNNFLPEEYAGNPDLIAHISSLVAIVKDDALESEAVIFLAALRLLELNDEVRKESNSDPFNLDAYAGWARQSVKLAMHAWRSSLPVFRENIRYNHLYALFEPHDADDFLGLLYQSIVIVGNKSAQGSYYTPSKLVEEALSHIDVPIKAFLDPCCGSGKYLLMAAKKFRLAPENIVGFDCDKIAANIARINVLMAFKNQDFSPNIFCMDALSESATESFFVQTGGLAGKIDAIATNPPWGAYKNAASKGTFSEKIKSGETFSLFLEKSIRLLRTGGRLSFLLPESILKIKIHADIRELILSKTRISKITMLGRQFTGVYTPVICLDLIKEEGAGSFVSVERKGNTDCIAQDRFMNNAYFAFDVDTESRDEALLNKLFSVRHATLLHNAEWALGIVTGDNKKWVLESNERGAEAVLRGSEVHPYYLEEPKSFIRFTPGVFQQMAPERYFRAPEKLVYKFISRKLVFAYDDRQCLTLNSANILIPSIPGIGIKTALAFLNSTVFQYIFKKKFSTHKVLRGNLEKLPFPLIGMEIQSTIERLVDAAIFNRHAAEKLEELIFSAFLLNEEQISIKKNQ
ncbi:MAG: TaqI-like C-terminal specificity domain-containing protein [Burkholderiales bacterium]